MTWWVALIIVYLWATGGIMVSHAMALANIKHSKALILTSWPILCLISVWLWRGK